MVLTLLATGVVSLAVSMNLFVGYKKSGLKETLMLALYALSYAVASFLWAIEDSLLVGNFQVATAAWIFGYIPAYLGVLFSVLIVGIRPKLITYVSSAIIVVAIISFLVFPLEYKIVGEIYIYYPATITKLILIAVAAMALTPVIIWIIYARGMNKFGDKKERDRGITLSIGFLLMALGENILVPYFEVSLFMTVTMCITGILVLYHGFMKREEKEAS